MNTFLVSFFIRFEGHLCVCRVFNRKMDPQSIFLLHRIKALVFFYLEETLQGDKCSLTKHTIGYNHLPVNNTTSAQMAFKPNFKKKLNKYLFLNASDNYA